MTHMRGRNIFLVSLANVLQPIGPALFLERAASSRFDAVWIRIGRGPDADANLQHPDLATLRAALKQAGVGLWGWHVAFCAHPGAARREADLVLEWAERHELDGVALDVERTPDNPRFRGGAREAEVYAGRIAEGLTTTGRGVALSTHDQPSLHRDMPFETLLGLVHDVTPQVYYRSAQPGGRFARALRDYKALLPAQDFAQRFKPTGNITLGHDVSHASAESCIAGAREFVRLAKEAGAQSYGFWCWDAAPPEVWEFLREDAG
jgi:hypothetical protein